MNDGSRIYPVDKTVMHHAVSDEMINWEDIDVQDWFSNVGKARGYSNGAINSSHEHPNRPGQQTYAMAHFALHKYNNDRNKYGWRLTPLMVNPWGNVAWHAGNWAVNQQSIGIETCGNYLDHQVDLKALMLVADTMRPQDRALNGGLEIYPHQAFFATQCPGQIKDQIETLIDMINNPDKWNEILWPKPAPAPAPAPAPKPELPLQITNELFNAKKYVVKTATHLVNIPDGSDATPEVYQPGRVIESIVERSGWSNGTSFLRTAYSKDHNIARGFRNDTLEEVVAPSSQPAPQPTETQTAPNPSPAPAEAPSPSTGPAPGQENGTGSTAPVTPAKPAKNEAWWLPLIAAILRALTRKKKA